MNALSAYNARNRVGILPRDAFVESGNACGVGLSPDFPI